MLEFDQVGLAFGMQRVLIGIDLVVAPGQRYGLLGSSGAGKSSLLRLAAGVVAPTTGRCLNRYQYPVLLFQEPRLLPWRRVRENVEIPLRAAGVPRGEAHDRAREWLYKVELSHAAEAWPAEISGGMAQRAALARAFALRPDLLLLDEPFSALDPALRASLSDLCTAYVRESGAALICSSHHPHELVRMVDHCLLIQKQKPGLLRYDIEDTSLHGRDQVAVTLHHRLLDQEAPLP